MDVNKPKYNFIIVALLSLGGLSVIAFFVGIDLHLFSFFSLLIYFLLAFEIIQLVRIFSTGITYKGWINSEIKSTGFVFILFLSVPNLSRGLFLDYSFPQYITIFGLVGITIFTFHLFYKIISQGNSFYKSASKKSNSDIIELLKEENIQYKIKESEGTTLLGSTNNGKEILLPKHECRILVNKEKTVVIPKNRDGKKNIYNLIDIIEALE